jgi:hypothetical protein
MTTEKWVWIAVGLFLAFSGYAIRGMIHSCPTVEIRDVDAEIKWDTARVAMYPATVRWDTVWVDSSKYTHSGIKDSAGGGFIPVQVYSMDTTRPITATVTNGTDTVDALTYVNVKSEFISAPFNEFRNVQVLLAPMKVSFKGREQTRIVYEEMRGGLGAEWVQEFGGSGGFKATGYIPLNSWLSFTPSVTVGSLSGAGGGIFIHW